MTTLAGYTTGGYYYVLKQFPEHMVDVYKFKDAGFRDGTMMPMTLTKLDKSEWPDFLKCHGEQNGITLTLREANMVLGKFGMSMSSNAVIKGSNMMMHGGHDTSGMYNHMGSTMSGSKNPAAGFTGNNGVMMHGGHDTAGMYNHMGSKMSGADAGFTPNNGVMMHGGHDADESMGGMYNRMDSKFSGSSNPAAGFSRGNGAMFVDMA
jgi:hypothetical protein